MNRRAPDSQSGVRRFFLPGSDRDLRDFRIHAPVAVLRNRFLYQNPRTEGFFHKVKLAKKKATVSNAKTIYMAAMRVIMADDNANAAFYTTKHDVRYEATPDGGIVSTVTIYGDISNQHSRKFSKKEKLTSADNYRIIVVARVDGIAHDKGGDTKNPTHITHIFNTWDATDSSYRDFVNTLCAEDDVKPYIRDGKYYPLKMPYQGREDGGGLPLIRWLIAYQENDPDQIEIWAGDGYKAENGPAYRVYPNPSSNYT